MCIMQFMLLMQVHSFTPKLLEPLFKIQRMLQLFHLLLFHQMSPKLADFRITSTLIQPP